MADWAQMAQWAEVSTNLWVKITPVHNGLYSVNSIDMQKVHRCLGLKISITIWCKPWSGSRCPRPRFEQTFFSIFDMENLNFVSLTGTWTGLWVGVVRYKACGRFITGHSGPGWAASSFKNGLFIPPRRLRKYRFQCSDILHLIEINFRGRFSSRYGISGIYWMRKIRNKYFWRGISGWRLSLIHIWRCRRSTLCRSRWSPYH